MKPVQIGQWHFVPGGREIRQGTTVRRLSELESGVLTYLVTRPGQEVSTRDLLRDVWSYADGVQSRAVTHLVARLRKKLDDDGEHIATVYGVGFRLDLQDLDGLFGRTELFRSAQDLLRTHRLLTLHGVAGAGKTTLAETLAATREHLWWSATGFVDVEDLTSATAHLLGLEPGSYTPRRLGVALHERGPLLLVVDAADTLDGEAVLAVLEAWLTAAPELQILLTSRVLLGQERWLRVGPLEKEAAKRLFRIRAEVVLPEREVAPEHVQAIVEAVQGLPLAVELAAARLRVMSADELVEELASDVRILGGGERSLQTLLQGSWEPLGESARRTMCGAALLRGRFTSATLAAVTGAGRVAVLDALDALVRASLVVEDLPSFYLLDVVRAFALERASDELKQRFVTWAAGRAERALGLVYADPPESMRALVEETPAYVEAAAHASSAEEVAWLALAIRAHDLLHGRPERSTELLEALDLDELPSRLRIDLMNVRWALQASAAPSEALLPLAERALAAARREGTTEQIVESWTRVLTNKMWRSGASEVVQECTDLISFSRANRVPELLLGSALWLKATVTERLQDYDTALAEMEEAAHLLEARTDLHSMAVVSLCVIHRLMGRPERHAALAERAYRQATKTKIASAILTTGFSAALAATELDDVRRASEIFGSIQPIAHELGDITRIFRIELGLTELTEDPLQARQRLRAIRLRARTEGRPIMEATALAQLGRRLHEAHSIERALAAYAEALSILESTDLQLDRTVTNTWYTLALCADGQSDAAREALKRCTARAGLGKLVADLGRARISGHPLPPHTRRSRTLRHTRTLPVTQD